MKPKNTQIIRPLSQAILGAAMLVGAVIPFCPSVSRAQSLELSVKDGGQERRMELATDEVEIYRHGESQTGKLKQTLEAKMTGATVIDDHTSRVVVKLNGAYDRQRLSGGGDGFHAAVPDSEVSPVLYIKGAPHDRWSRRIGTRDALVYLGAGNDAEQMRVQSGASEAVATPIDGVFKLKFPTAFHALDGVGKLTAQGVRAEPALRKQYEKKSVTLPLDEFFPDQWHLVNTGQSGATPGIDINVLPAWAVTKGNGVTATVVDDCLETTHPDLRQNAPLISTHLHHDFNDNDENPAPNIALGDRHGTSVGGLLGAAQNNGATNPVTGKKLGVSGVAPEVQLLGLRLISGPISDQDIYDAMTWAPGGAVVGTSNNSWGPPDGYYGLATPDILGKAGLRDAATNGRGGKGQVTVFAAGNGRVDYQGAFYAVYNDNSNTDGFANSRFVLAVGALGATGVYSPYSEPGANILICAPGGGFGSFGPELRLTTTDVSGVGGYNPGPGEPANTDYNNSFNGTSSASPVTTGVVSLILATNPDLGWRDVKEILAGTARRVDETNLDWKTNEGGFHFNHNYGAGLINAGSAVARAFNWQNLSSELKREIVKTEPGTGAGIPDDGTPLRISYDFTNLAKYPNIRLEQIEVETKIIHPSRGDLEIALISPLGTRSVLALPHLPRPNSIDPNTDYRDTVIDFVNGRLIFRDGGWVFTTTHHWGENSAGIWQLEIIDRANNTEKGRLQFSALRLYGTASGTQRVAFESQRYSAIEPIAGAAPLLQPIVIRRTGGTTGSFTVGYQTSAIGTATANQDYTPISGTVTFADGDMTQTIELPILSDTDPEDVETVNVVLTNLNGQNLVSFGGNTLTAVDIVDAENNKVSVLATDPEAAETSAELQPNTGKFTISRSKVTSTPLDVYYTLTGTALEGGQLGDDYAQLPTAGGFHIATIPAFAGSVDVVIVPADDSVIEGTESVILTLKTNGAAYNLGTPVSAIVNIVDNDRPIVQILATDDLALETPVLPVPVSATAKFTIKRSPVSDTPLDVVLQFGGTQILDTNYLLSYVDAFGATVHVTSIVQIPAGQESVEVTLTPIDDDIYQATKTVIISMLPSVVYDFSFGFLTSTRLNIIENDPFPDTKVPVLAVTSPVNGARFQVTDSITFTGSASDNESVDRVIYRLNRGVWQILPGIVPGPTAAWSIPLNPLDLIVGFNTLDVKAIDNDGNESRTFSSIFKRIQLRTLTTTTSGSGLGSIKPTPPTFEVGDLVKLQAVPAVGSVFGGWTGYDVSSNRLFTFAMPDQDVTLNAEFGLNPFTPATSGSYSGLVGTDPDPFYFETSGYMGLVVGPTGSVTGKLTFSGAKYSFKGEFLSNGTLSVTIPRKNTSPIQIELTIDLDASAAGTRRAIGTLATASSVSNVTVERAAYSKAVPAPVGLVKPYTVILPPAVPLGNLFQDPRAYGVAQMKIDANGLVKWKGVLPDGSVAVQAQALTKDNTWPMFLSLYKNRGVLLGRMTMDTAPMDSDMNGKYNWFKPVLERDLYFPLGFKIEQNDALGSIYTPPTAGRALLGFSDLPNNASITIAEGSLLVPIVKAATYLATNAIIITTPAADALKLNMNAKTGDLTGSFVHQVSGRSTVVKGILFQKQQAAFSFFKGTSVLGVSPQTGYLRMEQAH